MAQSSFPILIARKSGADKTQGEDGDNGAELLRACAAKQRSLQCGHLPQQLAVVAVTMHDTQQLRHASCILWSWREATAL